MGGRSQEPSVSGSLDSKFPELLTGHPPCMNAQDRASGSPSMLSGGRNHQALPTGKEIFD